MPDPANGQSLSDRERAALIERTRQLMVEFSIPAGADTAKLVEMIGELRAENERLAVEHKARGEAIVRLEIETEEIDRLKAENERLRSEITATIGLLQSRGFIAIANVLRSALASDENGESRV